MQGDPENLMTHIEETGSGFSEETGFVMELDQSTEPEHAPSCLQMLIPFTQAGALEPMHSSAGPVITYVVHIAQSADASENA